MASQATASRFPFATVVFAALFLLAPLPILVFEGSVPLARICLLAAVSVAVALREGASGPVGMIVGLLVGHALVYLLLVFVAARLAARGLRRLPQTPTIVLLGACVAAGAAVALVAQPYVTPFGLEPRANLRQALEVGW